MSTASPGSENGGRNLALLGAFCLFLSALEYMIPKPLPFMRIGLANLPLMLALGIFPLRSYLVLICIKVFGQGLITGTLFSYIFLFSLTGSFLSALIMYFLHRVFGYKRITFIGIGTAGAVVSSLSQLSLAHVFIFQENVRYIAPPFLAAALVTGIVLGVFCEMFTRRSLWYKQWSCLRYNCTGKRANEKEAAGREREAEKAESGKVFCSEEGGVKKNFYNSGIGARELFIAGIFIMPALLFNPGAEFRFIQFLFFWFLALLSGRKIDFIFTVLTFLFIVIFNLIIPYGKVLYSIAAFKITSGALEAGVHRAATLLALVMLSKAAIRQDLKIPGAFGKLLGGSLQIFSAVMSRKYQITGRNLVVEIDNLLLELSNEKYLQAPVKKIHTKPAGYFVLIIAVILSWLPWLAAQNQPILFIK